MKISLLLFSVTATYINLSSQTWQPFGIPSGGGVTDMVYWNGVGPNYLNKLWVTTTSENWPTGQLGGVYWSDTNPPGAGAWHQIAAGYTARTIDAGQDGDLYASIWYSPSFTPADGLYRFAPQAGVFGLLHQADSGDNIFSIAVKNNPHTIFAGTRNGLIRSTDDGVTFEYSNNGIPDSSWIYDIAIDSSGILAAASSNGVFISTDNGDNWLSTTGIPPEDTVVSLLFWENIDSTMSSNKSFLKQQDDDAMYAGFHDGRLARSFRSSVYTVFVILYLFEDSTEVSDQCRMGSRYIVALNQKAGFKGGDKRLNSFSGVQISTDEGVNWNELIDGLPPEAPCFRFSN